jgi:RHS repeat-associated protein
MTYTGRGQLLKQTKPNGNTLDMQYYLDGSVKQSLEKKSGGTVVAQHDLEYTPNGHRAKDVLKLMNADDNTAYIDNTYTYDYDPQDRIAKVTKAGDDPATESYTYDRNSNIVEQTLDGVTTTQRYDRNRLLSATAQGVTSTYNYDPLGRLDTVSTGGQTAEKYYYDGFDRTAKVRAGSGAAAVTTSYVFDPFDRTVSQTTSGAESKTTAFTYLGMDSTLLRETVDGKTDTDYQYLAGGQRATQIKHKDGGAKEYSQYVTSPRGDIEAITKEDGNTRATYGYRAYGSDDESQMTGADKPAAGGTGDADTYNAFRFNSARWDGASGTYDMGFRNYDPGLNRFLTRDAYSGALGDMSLATDPFTGNRYAFAGGNPITFVELDGHLFGLSLSDIGHAALDVVGLIPVVGEVADVANGIWYAAEGNYADAALSLSSAIPLVGYGATAVKAGKYAKKGLDAADSANDTRKAADKADDAADAAGSTRKTDGPDTPPAKEPDQPAASSCKTNSFVAGTQVVLADGSTRSIESLKTGDQVVATDPETGDTRSRTVTRTRDHEGGKDLVTLTVDSDGRNGKAEFELTSTAEHLYWLPDFGRWVKGSELQPGMWLQTSAGTWVQITAIDTAHRTTRVYNLSVEGVHTYYVGTRQAAVLVHNCGYENEAIAAQKRADDLKNQWGKGHGWSTVAVIGVRNKKTGDIVEKVSLAGGKKIDEVGQNVLNQGEDFIQGSAVPGRVTAKGKQAYEHAEEAVFNWVKRNPDYEVVYGGTSRNVCKGICAPLVQQTLNLGGKVFRGASDKTRFRMFWQTTRY